MTLFERFEQHKVLYTYLCIATYLFINNTINASSVWMENSRDGEPTFSMWEPFVWEYTSAIGTFLLLPVLFSFFKRFPPKLAKFKQQLLIHFLASVLFSAVHIVIMVSLREGIYLLNGGNYDFGSWLREFWFEYRKDAWGYLFIFFLYQILNYVYVRLKGEATPIAENEQQAEDKNNAVTPEHFLVKKLDKEFLIKVSDIEWAESSGNYVNLHSQGRIYPLRSSLSAFVERVSTAGFSRIHRSFAINHNEVESISYQASGDGEIQLKSGKVLNLSRRYKESFKQKLG